MANFDDLYQRMEDSANRATDAASNFNAVLTEDDETDVMVEGRPVPSMSKRIKLRLPDETKLSAEFAVNVKGFGATAGFKGVEASEAFQRAANRVKELGGGRVYVPGGDWYVDDLDTPPGVTWVGAGVDVTRIHPRPGSDNRAIFKANDPAGVEVTGVGFERFSIQGDGTSSKYRPNMDATVHGIEFGEESTQMWIQQCHIKDVFIHHCDHAILLRNHVRNLPIETSRLWYNHVALYVQNEHPAPHTLDIRYNDVGIAGTIQDMEAFGVRLVSNRVGSTASISRSSLIGCAAWQNIEYGFRNILEHNRFIGCQFRGAGTFWENLLGIPNESRGLEVFSRGNVIQGCNFWGGNGREFLSFASNNVQSGIGVLGNNVILDGGPFAKKVGTGAYTHVRFLENHFEISSAGNGEEAMVLHVPNVGGSWNSFLFEQNTLRNSAVQSKDFVVIESGGARHSLSRNSLYVTSGVSGGFSLNETRSCRVIENDYGSAGTGTYFNKLSLNTLQPGLIVRDNVNFPTEGSGAVEVPEGETFIDVPHGLELRPVGSSITLSPASNLHSRGVSCAWVDVSNITDTHFRVRLDSPPSANVTLIWNISVTRH